MDGCCRQLVWRIFFARTVRWKKQGLEVMSEWSVLERMNGKGVCVRW
ncbi:MAG: hypothetical protein GX429_00135 [Bacteroidales bacterium]|nr:hypothetical protein [Bacteroidales bacterium]